MNISEVRVKLTSDKDEKLRAFCSITVDNEFVIRDLKVIEGAKGLFVAMPSRKLTARCQKCGDKNHLRALYCNNCGVKLSGASFRRETDGRMKLHADIAHPINSLCRDCIQSRVIKAFRDETVRASKPGYKANDFYDEDERAIEDEATPGDGKTEKGKPDDNFSDELLEE